MILRVIWFGGGSVDRTSPNHQVRPNPIPIPNGSVVHYYATFTSKTKVSNCLIYFFKLVFQQRENDHFLLHPWFGGFWSLEIAKFSF